MADFDRGPATIYEIIWKSGHVDRIEAHQVLHPNRMGSLFGSPNTPPEPERVDFHGEFGGRWQLVLSADMADIQTIRNVSLCGEGL